MVSQAKRQLGEVLLEPRRKSGERLEFAALLGGLGIAVLDELAADGDGQPLGRHQLGLQDVVVILRLAVHDLGQAVLAVLLTEVQLPGAVQDHQEVAEQPSLVQCLHANQAMDQLTAQAIQGRRRHVSQEVIQRVAVGDGVLAAAAEAVEVLQRLWAVQLEPHLPARAELQHEHHQPLDQQERPAVGAHLLSARVDHAGQPGSIVRPEVCQGLAENCSQL